ncbi:MAG: TetR/AcrR family transcriptional regulator [Eubacteriaceae bacterium]|nr:TetR/AcrR family transcriptional regulator [Eubacteriaceae bacterium]
MEKGSTKDQILEAALELFSVKGFEATSVSQIADAVGIRKSSLYSHFASKQDILDTLTEEILVLVDKHSMFSEVDRKSAEFEKVLETMTVENVTNQIKGQVRFVIHDPNVSKARKMLVIEQFQNPTLSKMHTRQNYENAMNYFIDFFKGLIEKGKLKNEDTMIMASQFCLPITVWMNLCDREPEREDEVMELIERHVQQFFKVYGKE